MDLGDFSLLSLGAKAFQNPISNGTEIKDFFPRAEKFKSSWRSSAPWLWLTFAKPVPGASFKQSYFPTRSNSLATIERLPVELLDLIFDLLVEDKCDVILWGLSSSTIWSYVLRRIHSQHKPVSGFAGEEVGLLDFSEQWNFWVENGIAEPEETEVAGQEWMYNAERVRGGHWVGKKVVPWVELSDADWANIERDLWPCMYPQDRIWILRNLTTSEYIRSDKLQPSAPTRSSDTERKSSRGSSLMKLMASESPPITFSVSDSTSNKTLENPEIPYDTSPLSFAQIFLILIFGHGISQDRYYHEKTYVFLNGRWCRHRFDIVQLADHVAETVENDWADVSELAVDDIANLRYWVQQTGGAPYLYPDELRQHVEADREMYHNWEGLDTPLPGKRPKGRWMLKKPMQRGFLFRA